jgi:hypothetical protein
MGCGGGGDVQIQQPAAAPTTAEAVQAWVESMPTVFAEQQRQAPLEAQQQLSLLQQYGLPLSQALQSIDQSLYPQTAGIQENLAGIATQGANATQMPDWMRQNYLNEYNSQLGTNAGSPMGAEYTSRNMQNQLFGQQQYYQNLGLSLAGRQPLTAAQSPSYTNYASTFTPQNVANNQMSAYNSYMPYWQNYANQQGMLSMMPSQSQRIGQAWGNLLMGGGSGRL